MLSPLNIIEQLAETKGKNDKLAFLKNFENDRTIKAIMRLGIDPSLTFGYLKTITDDMLEVCKPYPSNIDIACDLLFKLALDKPYSGHALEALILDMVGSLPSSDREVVKRILKKDLACGVAASTVNKVWPGLIFQPKYHGARSGSDKNLGMVAYPAALQLKEDGIAVYAEIKGDEVVFRHPRSGYVYHFPQSFTDDVLTLVGGRSGVVTMEGLVINVKGGRDNEFDRPRFKKRSKGNAYIKKAYDRHGYQGHLDEEIIPLVRFSVYDFVEWEDYNGEVKYKDRRPYIFPECKWFSGEMDRMDIMDDFDFDGQERFFRVPGFIVDDLEEAQDFVRAWSKSGHEGGVLRGQDGGWYDGKPKYCVKIKKAIDVDMRVIGMVDYKHGGIGSLVCTLDDDDTFIVKANVPKPEDRARPFSDFDGKVVRVCAHTVSCTGNSLDHPVFDGIRDKDTTDKREDIK